MATYVVGSKLEQQKSQELLQPLLLCNLLRIVGDERFYRRELHQSQDSNME